MDEKLIQMQGIKKQYPGVLAVDNVSLELGKGEILALVGENGAGKSTLMKILSGAIQPDGGSIRMQGKEYSLSNPYQAIKAGINIIYQELNTCETTSIAENIFVGNIPSKGRGITRRIDREKMLKESSMLLQKLGIEKHPDTLVAELSVAQKQIVEIAKALSRDTKVLIMDEPTAALNEKEVVMLFGIIRRLRDEGTGIIYISHRLDEVMELSDRIQIMRDGKSVFTGRTEKLTKNEIISYMIGHEMTDLYQKKSTAGGEVVFEVQNLSTKFVRDISFKVHKGEVLGLFGLMGCGRTQIADAIFGARKKESGTILIKGGEVKIKSPRDAKRAGIAYITNDRKLEGLMLEHSVRKNISITVLHKFAHWFGIEKQKELDIVNEWVKRLNVKTGNVENPANSLSGGNQQKVVMAKWLAAEPDIIILNEPTRGVDVGAKQEIYAIINKLCSEGMAVIAISSELPEIIGISDRVAVIHEGKLSGELNRDELTQHNLMAKAVGE